MQGDLKERIERRAHFVAGRYPWFRSADDAATESAVRDVKLVLDRLPAKLNDPKVSGGTTASPDSIITLTWLISGYTTVKSVSVSFKGNNQCDVHWDEPVGAAKRHKNISVDDVIKLYIPQKIYDLIRRAPGISSRLPRVV